MRILMGVLFALLVLATAAEAAPVVQATLIWQYNPAETQPVDGVRVERRIGTTGAWETRGTVSPADIAFGETGLALSTTYCYRAIPFNVAGDGPVSPDPLVAPNGACATSGAPPTVPLQGLQLLITITPGP